MAEDLVEYFKKHINNGADISYRVKKALRKIEEEENQDLSEVIQHLEIAEANFYAALEKMGAYETEAIRRVEARYRAMSTTSLNNPINILSQLWKNMTN